MNKKLLFGTAILGSFMIFFSLGIFIVKEVGGFELFGSKDMSCTPYNVFIRKGEMEYSVEIEWATKEKCYGFVQYGTGSNEMNLIGVDLENSSKSKVHSVVLKNILSSKRYYFVINSGEQEYGLNNIPLEFVLKNL
jgi:hypothetical protein